MQALPPDATVAGKRPPSGRNTSTSFNFNLDTFSSKDFVVKDWIEKLSGDANPKRRSGPLNTHAAFDPKPLIRAFEAARIQLGGLSDELEIRENELSAAVRRAETHHGHSTSSLKRTLEQSLTAFQKLDLTPNGLTALDTREYSDEDDDAVAAGEQEGNGTGAAPGGTAALRIGERLEELERQRQRARDAKRLVQCWLEVSERGSLSSLEQLQRRPGGEGKLKSAALARQLLKISQRMDQSEVVAQNSTNGLGQQSNASGRRGGISGGQDNNSTRERIERFLEALENDLLNTFDQHYRRRDHAGMKECATALRDFNEGASVSRRYVNQHTFFIDIDQIAIDEADDIQNAEAWDRIADPDADPPGVEPGLQALIDRVGSSLQDESFDIRESFPVPDEILNKFIQRIFQQLIQQRLELVLERAGEISSLSFLRALQSSRSYLGTFVEEMKSHGLTEHPDVTSLAVTSNLDQQLEDLFIPYLSGSSYIDREKRNLDELYSSLLFKFTTYHSSRKKTPTTYLDILGQRGAQLLQSARDAYMDRLDSSDLPVSQKATLLRIAGLKDTEGNKEKPDIDVTEEDGKVNVSHAKRMIKWLAEGVGRSLELNSGNETPRDVQALLSVLLTQMGEIYLNSALIAASDLVTAQEVTKSEPDITYLPSLRSIIQILHLLQTTINTMLLPLTVTNITIRRDIEKSTTATLSNLESKISTILQRTLDASLAWIVRLLQAQKKTDFKPRDEDLALVTESLQTPTCYTVFTFMTKIANLATQTLDGTNLSNFLAELATGLRSLLFEHFRKFSVSLTGGLIVSKDVTRYSELIRGWPLHGTTFEKQGGMEVLVEVAHLFVIGPEALRERLKGGARSREEVIELRKYVERREDVNTVSIQAVLSSL